LALIVFGNVLPWLVVALGCWLGYQLVRQNGRMLLRLESLEQRLAQLNPAPASEPAPAAPQGLPIGSAAPDFELPDLSGTRKALTDFRGKRLLLIFFNPRCGFCTQMAGDLAALPIDGAGARPVPLVVSTGDAEENWKLVQEHHIRCSVLLQEQMEVAGQYQAHGTPMGYLVDEQGRIASGIAVGSQALLALADGRTAAATANGSGHAAHQGNRDLSDSKIQRNGLPAGTPAPSFTLPTLDGGELSPEEYRGRKVLLVFSDPKCGPCQALAPQLEQAHRRSGDVQLLMVSRGDMEANREKAEGAGLTFPVVLQKQWEVSRAYAMFATPVAYLIDENGIIAADVATGADAILSLLTRAISSGKAAERRCKCGKPVSECGSGECGCRKANGRATAVKQRRQ
jgi:peroxiredoxin